MKQKYNSLAQDNAIKIYIDGLLHICIKKEDLIGFQSWVEGELTKRFIIEIYTKNQTFITGYDEKDKWINVLKEFDKLDLFSRYDQP